MTEKCFLDWCGNTPSENVFLLSFPKNKEKLLNWCRILNININDIKKYEKAKICSCHFRPENMKATLSKVKSSQNNSTKKEDHNYNKNTTNRTEEGTLFECLQIELAKNSDMEAADPLKIPNEDDEDDDDDEYDDSTDNYVIECNDDYDNNVNEDIITITDDENSECSIEESSIARSGDISVTQLNRDESKTRGTNTPKRFYSEEFYPEKYQERVDKNNEAIKNLKRQLELKKKEIKVNVDCINELKKRKLENSRVITLLKKQENKIPLHIYSNLFNEDNNDSMKWESIPEELRTLAVNLYNCSKQAYDFIRETFQNTFPSPEEIEKYRSQDNNTVESNTTEIIEVTEIKPLDPNEEEMMFMEDA